MVQVLDDLADDATVHIRIDHNQVTRDDDIRWLMLEQMVISTYEDTRIVKQTNQYGLLTDIWIYFRDANDATHFRLRFQ